MSLLEQVFFFFFFFFYSYLFRQYNASTLGADFRQGTVASLIFNVQSDQSVSGGKYRGQRSTINVEKKIHYRKLCLLLSIRVVGLAV